MKKSILFSIIAVILSVSFQSQALLVAVASGTKGLKGNFFAYNPGGLILCILSAPLCLLDEDGRNITENVTESDLMNNGYTRNEARQILSDKIKFQSSLLEKDLSFTLGRYENAQTLRSQILYILPGASFEFQQYILDASGIVE